MNSGSSLLETGASSIKRPDSYGLLRRLYEVCPEIVQLGLFPVVLGKGSRY